MPDATVGFIELIVADIVLHRVPHGLPLPAEYIMCQSVPILGMAQDRMTRKNQALVFRRDDNWVPKFAPDCPIVRRYYFCQFIDDVDNL